MTAPLLSPLQYEIARLYATGLPAHEIAVRAGTTYGSVKCQLPRLRKRLGVSTRRDFAAVLERCEVRPPRALNKPNRLGMHQGDAVRFVSGPHAGKDGIYLRSVNSHQWRVRIGTAEIAVMAKHIQPKEQT